MKLPMLRPEGNVPEAVLAVPVHGVMEAGRCLEHETALVTRP